MVGNGFFGALAVDGELDVGHAAILPPEGLFVALKADACTTLLRFQCPSKTLMKALLWEWWNG